MNREAVDVVPQHNICYANAILEVISICIKSVEDSFRAINWIDIEVENKNPRTV